jgi:hypothetical protein
VYRYRRDGKELFFTVGKRQRHKNDRSIYITVFHEVVFEQFYTWMDLMYWLEDNAEWTGE